MAEVTIDGIKVEAPEGSMVIQAAHQAGVYVPHFCYHKKLSIAANCRMCLVDVEKAPKALPACATPVTNGMIVHTRSEKAVAAQKSVMEFLLINHPLDCPVCDQGGECQLQDLAVGYGASSSRYGEEKRVVFHKQLGPLISAEAMQRCIHCTRCVRLGEEIGGIQEMGMLHRGEHSEITTFVGRAIESELSGNMIDVCPVGALLSKPFRFSARTWELARRYSISPHDSLGANLVVQAKRDQVMRVVPFENEAVNECWISDRDRFSYEGLYAEDRLTKPMIRGDNGEWREASWAEALQTVVSAFNTVRDHYGPQHIAGLGSETATLEELSLLARLVRALGSEHVDHRLRQLDAGLDDVLVGTPWLGMPVADLSSVDRVLVVGAFLRADHPLMTQRLRQAVRRGGAQVNLIDPAGDDPLFPVANRLTVSPDGMLEALSQVLVAVAKARNAEVPAGLEGVQPSEQAQAIADSLAGGERVAVLLGNLAVSLPQASRLAANASALASLLSARFGFLTAGANTVGGYLAGATPRAGGRTAAQLLAEPMRAYLVLHAEPGLDSGMGLQAEQTLEAADFAVALTPYRGSAERWADVMLPISPFTETSGTFVNAEGRAQSFRGAAAPLGDTRPGWKVLRVLGNLFELQGFDEETSEAVRDAVLAGGIESRLSNEIKLAPSLAGTPGVVPRPAASDAGDAGLARVADVPIYRSDAIVRRSAPLQATRASQPPAARVHGSTLAALGLEAGVTVRVRSAQGEALLPLVQDDALAPGCVRVSAAFEETAVLGHSAGRLTLERA